MTNLPVLRTMTPISGYFSENNDPHDHYRKWNSPKISAKFSIHSRHRWNTFACTTSSSHENRILATENESPSQSLALCLPAQQEINRLRDYDITCALPAGAKKTNNQIEKTDI